MRTYAARPRLRRLPTAELHVREAHPDMELTPETTEMVKGLVRAT